MRTSTKSVTAGTRPNFEIDGGMGVGGGGGGGGTLSNLILGGTRHFFLLTLYNFKNIGVHVPPPALPCSAVPAQRHGLISVWQPLYTFKVWTFCRKVKTHLHPQDVLPHVALITDHNTGISLLLSTSAWVPLNNIFRLLETSDCNDFQNCESRMTRVSRKCEK